MRVDPFYVSNMVGALDQAQATEQQLTKRTFERCPRDFIESGSGRFRRKCSAA